LGKRSLWMARRRAGAGMGKPLTVSFHRRD
jgi:hypothetical protein